MIAERPDGVEPTVELHRDASGVPMEPATTRSDLPRGRPDPGRDPTRQDLPGRPRRGSGGTRGTETIVFEPPVGGPPRSEAAEPEDDRSGAAGGGRTPRRRSGRRWVRRAVALMLALALGIPLLAGFRVWYVARQDDRTHSDAIIVLGAAQYNGRPSAVLEWRLLHALKLYREGVAPAVVTVGGNRPGDNYTEAGTGKTWLLEHGVPESRVVAVPSGSDTLQSMIDVGRAYRKRGWHTGVIVTDPWHALRSRTMAEDNGIDAVTSPTRSGPTVGSRDTQFHYIVRETGGYLYYMLVERWRGGS